jgi:hypothetical protein
MGAQTQAISIVIVTIQEDGVIFMELQVKEMQRSGNVDSTQPSFLDKVFCKRLDT